MATQELVVSSSIGSRRDYPISPYASIPTPGSQYLNELIESLPYMLFLEDCLYQRIVFANRYAQSFFGLYPSTTSQDVRRLLSDFIHPSDRSILDNARCAVFSGKDRAEFEVRSSNNPDDCHWLSGTATILKRTLDGTPALISWCFEDITSRRRAEENLRLKSYLDPMTNLFNRTYFEEQIERLEREPSAPISILMIDVDGLKQVNDSRGHSAGDDLLTRAGQVLRQAFRMEDIVARIGGDEFAILLPHTDHEAAGRALQRIEQGIERDNQDRPDLPVNLSIGLAVSISGDGLRSALKRADACMYQAKRRKRTL